MKKSSTAFYVRMFLAGVVFGLLLLMLEKWVKDTPAVPVAPLEAPEIKKPPEIRYVDPPATAPVKPRERFTESGNRTVVDDRFLKAVQWVESRNNPRAVGTSGERGLFQIMPGTWEQHTTRPFGDAFDPAANRQVAVKHMRWIESTVRRYGGEPTAEVVAACYNAGVERMRRVKFDVPS
jgi:soluble lytic murein transglycosylase-like protein